MTFSFPVELTPFEEYFLYKDTVDNPSTFCVEMEFAGRLDRELTVTATQNVCRLHRLFECRVDMNKGRPRWVLTDTKPSIEWFAQPPSVTSLSSLHIDITVEPPLRIYGYDGAEGPAKLIFLFHHTAVDGLGTRQWLADFLKSYQSLQNEESLPDLKRDLRLLEQRCRSGLTWGQKFRLLPGQWLSVRETFRILNRKTIPLVPWDLPKSAQPRSPSCIDFELSPSETKELKKETARIGTSLNSWALRSLLVCIQRWQEKNNCSSPAASPSKGTHFRIVVPINERGRSHKSMPACNHCTMINFDFPRNEVQAESNLLQDIDQTFSVIRRWKLSFNCWRAMRIFRGLPGGLKKFAENDSVAATALLTNVGRTLQNDAVLTSHSTDAQSLCAKDNANQEATEHTPLRVANFRAYPPLQRGMVLAIVLYYFNNALRISAQYDQRFLRPVDAQHLMDGLRQELLPSSGKSQNMALAEAVQSTPTEDTVIQA